MLHNSVDYAHTNIYTKMTMVVYNMFYSRYMRSGPPHQIIFTLYSYLSFLTAFNNTGWSFQYKFPCILPPIQRNDTQINITYYIWFHTKVVQNIRQTTKSYLFQPVQANPSNQKKVSLLGKEAKVSGVRLSASASMSIYFGLEMIKHYKQYIYILLAK